MSSVPDDDLVQHARALRSLARSLVAPQDADDLVQDAALQALRRPPAHARSWFAWLGGVVKKRAAKHHRGEARRERRERALPEREPDVEALPLRVAAHRETIARLDAALLALPEPYQGTLLLRYFEDLTPTAIAARSGESLATVKSRLQRGLELLRQRLAADGHDRDWRGGLVVAFGLGRRSAVAGLVAAGVTTMVGKLVLGAAAAALAVMFLWPADAPPPPASASTARGDAVAPAKGEIVANGERTEASPSIAAQPAANSAAGGEPLVVYVGRCVDEQGAPLEGAKVIARCRTNNGGDVLRSDEQQSAADGTFCVRLPLSPKASHHYFEASATDHCEATGTFDGMVASERVDLGDIVLPVACTVRGRVVDRAGAPQAGVTVSFDRATRERRPLHLDDAATQTADDGSFAHSKLPPSRYAVAVSGRLLADGSARLFELGRAVRSLDIEVVVEEPPSPCRGIVVDESGAPIADANVRIDFGEQTNTDRDGRFAVRPEPAVKSPVARVSVSREGYVGRDAEWSRGDTAELRIVMTRQPAVTVRVVDAGGAAVTAFAVRVLLSTGWGEVRDLGRHHENGISRLTVPEGDWRVLVKPSDEALAPSAFVPLRVDAGRSAEVTVVVAPWCRRRLVVTDGTKPLGDVRVELLDPGEARVQRNTETFPSDDVKLGGALFAAILQAGDTGADGALSLRGPRGALALRLKGGGVALQVVQPVRLDEAGDLVVVAERAAQWRGRLVPPDVAAALLAMKAPPGRPQDGVGIELVAAANREEPLRRYFEPRFPFAADGSFAIDGLPAGTWHVLIGARPLFGAATISLRAGEVLTQDVDVRALAPADVTLRFLVDGKPAANTWVNAIGQHAVDVFGRRFGSGSNQQTDAAGCMSFRTFVGDLTFHVYLDQTRAAAPLLVAAASVRAPGPQELTLDLQLGGLDLDVRAPDGAPAAGVDIELSPVGALYPTRVRSADDGALRVPVFAGSYMLRVQPKRLATQAARDEFTRLQGYEALQNSWIVVGTIDVAPGAARPQRLTLPDAWAR